MKTKIPSTAYHLFISEALTDDQEDFQTWCIAHGVRHSVARTSDEALEVLGAWGALRIRGAP